MSLNELPKLDIIYTLSSGANKKQLQPINRLLLFSAFVTRPGLEN